MYCKIKRVFPIPKVIAIMTDRIDNLKAFNQKSANKERNGVINGHFQSTLFKAIVWAQSQSIQVVTKKRPKVTNVNVF